VTPRVFDLFCGGGGSSLGARSAGAIIAGGAEIGPYACQAFSKNFPEATMYNGDLRELDPTLVLRDIGPIDLLLASPECTNHTCAKGSAPRSEESRDTALQVIRFAETLTPGWIILENVVHMRPWKRYQELCTRLRGLGYSVDEFVLDASKFGVPQRRRRLFVVASREAVLPKNIPETKHARTARSILDPSGSWPTSLLFSANRAIGTIERAERAFAQIGRNSPFLLVYYGTDGSGGWQSLDVPLRTVTTLDRFALVEPGSEGHTIRMLQPTELRRAMGFPAGYLFPQGTRREKIMLLGNAVCPPVMRSIVRCLGGTLSKAPTC